MVVARGGGRYYKAERKKQAELVLEPFANMSSGTKNYEALFHQVAGFFLVEDNARETTPCCVLSPVSLLLSPLSPLFSA